MSILLYYSFVVVNVILLVITSDIPVLKIISVVVILKYGGNHLSRPIS